MERQFAEVWSGFREISKESAVPWNKQLQGAGTTPPKVGRAKKRVVPKGQQWAQPSYGSCLASQVDLAGKINPTTSHSPCPQLPATISHWMKPTRRTRARQPDVFSDAVHMEHRAEWRRIENGSWEQREDSQPLYQSQGTSEALRMGKDVL